MGRQWKGVRLGYLWLLVGVFLVHFTLQAQAEGYVQFSSQAMSPSFPGETQRVTTRYSCFDSLTGSPLDCSFTHRIVGLEAPATDEANNGGHFHYSDRPHSLNNQPLEYPADQNPLSYIVTGSTLSTPPKTEAEVVHPLPQVSGKIRAEGVMTLPYGWYCTEKCYSGTTFRYDMMYYLYVGFLEELPAQDDGGDYTRTRTPEEGHPDSVSFYGDSLALEMLPKIAKKYKKLRGRPLSVNDMSLPKGGLFDIYHNWKSPHSTHREGKDADINQDGIYCVLDYQLTQSTDYYLSRVYRSSTGKMESALLCERCEKVTDEKGEPVKCRKHLDFEGRA